MTTNRPYCVKQKRELSFCSRLKRCPRTVFTVTGALCSQIPKLSQQCHVRTHTGRRKICGIWISGGKAYHRIMFQHKQRKVFCWRLVHPKSMQAHLKTKQRMGYVSRRLLKHIVTHQLFNILSSAATYKVIHQSVLVRREKWYKCIRRKYSLYCKLVLVFNR